jgi:hypothetical protein
MHATLARMEQVRRPAAVYPELRAPFTKATPAPDRPQIYQIDFQKPNANMAPTGPAALQDYAR